MAAFAFEVGEKLRVKLKGKRLGQIGTVRRKGRMAETKMPPPDPKNYYWLQFEDDEGEESFSEENLELA